VVQDLRMVLSRTYQQVAELRKEVRSCSGSSLLHAGTLLPAHTPHLLSVHAGGPSAQPTHLLLLAM
jgi:hypothetical protein